MKENVAEKWLMTKHEIAAALGCSARKVDHLMATSQIPFLKLGGSVRFDPDVVREYLRKRCTVNGG